MSRSQYTASFLPNDLTSEILSHLRVKTLSRLRCVSQSWDTLISDPFFAKLHLKKSAQKPPHLILSTSEHGIASLSIDSLLKNPSKPAAVDGFKLDHPIEFWRVVGSCNGLLCFVSNSSWLYFMNPATRERGKVFYNKGQLTHRNPLYEFTFGCCDDTTGIYKVVAYRIFSFKGSCKSIVKIFSLGDESDSWRNIESFPVIPLDGGHDNNGVHVHLRGTINWLALRNYYALQTPPTLEEYVRNYRALQTPLTVDEYVILSLDLSRERYNLMLLPRGFDRLSPFGPTLRVLRDCLCFTHGFEETHLVLWQMKEFGVQDSWTQLLKIPCQDFYSCYSYRTFGRLIMLPLYLSEDGDKLLLVNTEDYYYFLGEVFVYNCRDNEVTRLASTEEISWFMARDYIESLVKIQFLF